MERRTFQNSLCTQSGKNKGFTQAELLIVVAIIGVLVSIAIPVFSSQLERTKQTADLAEIRSAYAEASVDALTNNGRDGIAEAGPMKHTGFFTLLNEANIGNLDLKKDYDANYIAKDYSVIISVSSIDGTVHLSLGKGGNTEGKTASDEEIKQIKKDNHSYTGYRDYPYVEFTANGNRLRLYRPTEVLMMGSSISSSTVYKTAEYGVPMTTIVNDEGYSRLYFKWDGVCWYQSRGAGYPWERVGPK